MSPETVTTPFFNRLHRVQRIVPSHPLLPRTESVFSPASVTSEENQPFGMTDNSEIEMKERMSNWFDRLTRPSVFVLPLEFVFASWHNQLSFLMKNYYL